MSGVVDDPGRGFLLHPGESGGAPDPAWTAALMARYATRPVEPLADPGTDGGD